MADDEQLDREVVARILRRATELSDSEADRGHDRPTTIEVSALIAAAGEVGLAPEVMRRSIAIESLGAPLPHRRGDGLVGPATVSVDDELGMAADAALQRLDAWLVDGHHLRRDRLRDGRGEWSKRTGVVGGAMRAARGVTGEGRLGDLGQLTASARDTGDGSCVMRIEADRSTNRTHAIVGGAVVGTMGATGVVAAAAIVSPLIAIASPIVVIAGLGVAATGRTKAARVRRELARVLESVHQGTAPTRLSIDVARRVTGRARAVSVLGPADTQTRRSH
jgi:hypothetical protein